jgi:hypothetical protein
MISSCSSFLSKSKVMKACTSDIILEANSTALRQKGKIDSLLRGAGASSAMMDGLFALSIFLSSQWFADVGPSVPILFGTGSSTRVSKHE